MAVAQLTHDPHTKWPNITSQNLL